MLRKASDPCLKVAAAVLAMAALCMVGCTSDPDPPPQPDDLTPERVSDLITQRWSHDEFNHFTVTFHSDTLIPCGIQNDLWKRVETLYQGVTMVTYELTAAGRKALLAINLRESGKFHEVILQGPYLVSVTGITPSSQPDLLQAAIRWDIDWNKAPAGLKACLPRFELTGTQIALFKLDGLHWSFVSFQRPEDAAAPPQAQPQATDATTLPSILHQ